MPHVVTAQRYNSAAPYSDKQYANLKDEMRRDTAYPTTRPVNPPNFASASQVSAPQSYHVPASPATPIKNGFRGNNGYSEEVGGYQLGYGGYRQSQYPSHTYAPQRQTWPYEGQTYQDTFYGQPTNQQWFGQQPYHGSFNQQGHSNWQQPGSQYQALYPTAPASQALQQQYAPTYVQPWSYQPWGPYGFQQNKFMLTQHAYTGSDGGVPLEAPMPFEQSVDTSRPTPRSKQSLEKSVLGADLNKRYRVNKRSRYEQVAHNSGFYDNFQPPTLPSTVLRPPPTTAHRSDNVPWRGTGAVQNLAPAGREEDKQPSFRMALRPKTSKTPEPTKYLLKRPIASAQYLMQANEDPVNIDSPRPLLVVLDLNGTLLHRTQRGGSNFTARPRVNEFLHYLQQNHCLMVWSSAKPTNVGMMCDKLFTKDQKARLAAIWARDTLRLSDHEYGQKVQVYKQLSWIWEDRKIQSTNPNPANLWSQENTVLIDDSVEKAASEPYNILQLEEFEGKREQMEADVLGQVVRYLETLRCQRDVSAYMRTKPYKYDPDEEPFDWEPIIEDMR